MQESKFISHRNTAINQICYQLFGSNGFCLKMGYMQYNHQSIKNHHLLFQFHIDLDSSRIVSCDMCSLLSILARTCSHAAMPPDFGSTSDARSDHDTTIGGHQN